MLLLLSSACIFKAGMLDIEPSAIQSIELTLQPDGSLGYCDASGCRTVENPEGCALLEISVNLGTGEACERCLDAQSGVISERCADTLLVCAVITAPEPDCVVCTIRTGSVIYSSCTPDEPLACVYFGDDGEPVAADPASGASACSTSADCAAGNVCVATNSDPAGLCLPNCRVCYDTSGRAVLSACHAACAEVACPAIACAPGFVAVTPAGDCCPQCLPAPSCESRVCSGASVPSCPSDTDVVRDPTDCCHFTCQARGCDADATTAPAAECPQGYAWEVEYPECGRCVLVDDSQPCRATSDCTTGEECTTELGDCRPSPDCSAGAVCDTCWGVCRPIDHRCDLVTTASTSYCEGTWVSPGVDAYGCPLPPACQCPDGVLSADGTCTSQCGLVTCLMAPPVCASGYHLSTDYPYCCGTCVPDSGCGDGSLTWACPAIACAEGYHTETDGNCCPTCVRDPSSCTSNDQCLAGEYCSTSTSSCTPNGCTGTCMPAITCSDSDGIDPLTHGKVTGTSYDYSFTKEDTCSSTTTLVEVWCYPADANDTGQAYGMTTFTCERGCEDGRCLP